jgi:hypothetical protein
VAIGQDIQHVIDLYLKRYKNPEIALYFSSPSQSGNDEIIVKRSTVVFVVGEIIMFYEPGQDIESPPQGFKASDFHCYTVGLDGDDLPAEQPTATSQPATTRAPVQE